MNPILKFSILGIIVFPLMLVSQEPRTLEEARAFGASRSKYLNNSNNSSGSAEAQVEPDLETYRKEISPLLQKACLNCHGPESQEAEFRVDDLDPDLLHGKDEDWWLEVQNVLSNAEMPPADADVQLEDGERAKIIQWLSQEVQFASKVRRGEKAHSSFRRMTRYEYTYAVQDLLGLPLDFGGDLPPETSSEDGFFNSSEYLLMSVSQLEKYRELSRNALMKATVRGEQPTPVKYSISMTAACDVEKHKKKKPKANLNANHFLDETSGERIAAANNDVRKIFVFRPKHLKQKDQIAENQTPKVLILPSSSKHYLSLGNFLPDAGPMRIRVKASLAPDADTPASDLGGLPSLQISFGFRPTNDSYIDFPLGDAKTINASKDESRWYEWEAHLGEISRNSYRTSSNGRKTANQSEFILLRNTAKDRSAGAIRIEEIEIAAADYPQWPPHSHRALFPERLDEESDDQYAERVLSQFMQRAWRRTIRPEEVEQKLELFRDLHPTCMDTQEALTEVLATVLSSPNFLYLQQPVDESKLSDFELATRLSIFLWSSIPDETLLDLAAKGELRQNEVLIEQTYRMLNDAKSKRFSNQFVRQWLGLQLLDYLDVDKKTYRDVDQQIVESMKQEPIELFHHMLGEDCSIMDFLHSDYTMADRTLARYYGIKASLGSDFQKVSLGQEHRRGGLLTQSGLLAMNSDGKDSNPLKRGIWLLERILNDPPPPPPAAVPEIDLADPEILKMTLKERLEDHRNDVACKSCHQRIDPWGIAFENFDAVGRWRDNIKNEPVDATSTLFNQQRLDGVNGLKRYLLENRQDQFARALVYKMSAYAMGRPIGFSDRAEIESITTQLRKNDDGLATLIQLIVTSELFRSK